MLTEKRICQNCQQNFVIEPEDFEFYAKIKVPPPTWCPECRMMMRFASINLLKLYKRPCGKCGKQTVTIHHPESPLKVYCLPCWWADDWDGTEYGREYDDKNPFSKQLRELQLEAPFQALEAAYLTLVNSDYATSLGHCKNCYLIFWADFCENVLYSVFLNNLKDSLDCYRVKDSELLYECIGINKSSRCYFSEECDGCMDMWFSRSCFGCTNCLGCINLRSKSFCIFNKQYTKEEYFKKLASMNLASRKQLAAYRAEAHAFWLKYPHRAYIGNSLNLNVTGDYVYESKNTKEAFMVSGAEDSRYVQFISVPSAKDCYDYTGWGNDVELIYQSAVVGENSNNVKFSFECWPNAMNIEYSIYAISSKNVFGCVNLKKKEYAILNKVYTKEKFMELRDKIIKDMKERPFVDEQKRLWTYGDYLPISILHFAYNESLASEFWPKGKEEGRALGFVWREGASNLHAATISAEQVPDTIEAVGDDITNETIGCVACGNAFRIISQELSLYRTMQIPIPVECPMCRIKARFARSAKPKFYDRTCSKCGKEIKTSYAPNRPEIVYCEACYQNEVA